MHFDFGYSGVYLTQILSHDLLFSLPVFTFSQNEQPSSLCFQSEIVKDQICYYFILLYVGGKKAAKFVAFVQILND